MQKIKKSSLGVICFFIISFPVQAQSGTSQSQFKNRLDSFVNQLMAKVPVIPGIAIAVVNTDGPVFLKGYGWANKEAGIR